MKILGISAYYHDAAACLVVDGRIVAAAQEERFTQVKHDASFPARALAYCMAEGGLRPAEIDHVVFYDKPFLKFERLLETYLAFAPSGFGSFARSLAVWLKDKLFQKQGIARDLTLYSGEYKVMGLAPYGQPRVVALIKQHLIDIRDNGSFALDMAYFGYCTGDHMVNSRFERLFRAPSRQPESALGQREMDLAASAQAVTEEVVLKLARSVARSTGQKNLCLAGGVALNWVANGKLLRDGCFERIWVQPAAGAQFSVHTDADVIDLTARALAAGQAIGWHQGRMEFGPRSLGARSILADPRSPGVQRQLNLKVKYRESFRPFAPSVLREDAAQWFELDGDSPYMLIVADVAAAHQRSMSPEQHALFGIDKLNVARSDIPAVTHVDYSARIQTASADDHPRFHQLLCRFKAITGCPVLVNISFNVRGEPIVESPEDAFRCRMGTDLDLLVIGNSMLKKADQNPDLARDYTSGYALD